MTKTTIPPLSRLLAIAFLAVTPLGASAQSEADFDRVARSTVFIKIEGRLSNGEIPKASGSGFFIDGRHILTAQHNLFYRNSGGIFEQYFGGPPTVCVAIGNHDLTTTECHAVDIVYPLDLTRVDPQQIQYDVALLYVREGPKRVEGAPLALCAQELPQRGSDRRLTAYGFPEQSGLIHRSGTYDDQRNREWRVDMRTRYGMSGGPVVNDRGAVVGVLKGGESTGLYSVVTPLKYTLSMLNGFGADLNACREDSLTQLRPVTGACDNATLEQEYALANSIVFSSDADKERIYTTFRALACNAHEQAVRFAGGITGSTIRDACSGRVVEDLVVKGQRFAAGSLAARLPLTFSSSRSVINRIAIHGAIDVESRTFLDDCPVPKS